ncbi:MAG: phosphonopyruvate decarboxylase [Myxococcota bacterium]|nr:phosphonopyruvate decarboxylase [Myxococcota bacterium]
MPLDPQLLFSALLSSGIKGMAGVPCSILNHLILEAEASSEVDYVAASVEGEAVSTAAGMWLSGGLGAALMQNSGLGNAVNPLASLSIPYEIPVLMIVSWRGEPGTKDAVHHYPMGEATPGLFDLLGIPTQVLREDTDLDAAVGEAVAFMKKERKPAALIVPRGVFAKGEGVGERSAPILSATSPLGEAPAQFSGGALPSRTQVLKAWVHRFPEALAVSTTGYMSREVASLEQVDRHFPMQGSMGFAPAIALGICRSLPDRPVHVLDGDGALIMRMGSLATIGALAPRHFIHVVVDNGTYASTGGQLTVSPSVDFTAVARGCGYRATALCQGANGLEAAMDWAAQESGEGPILLHISVDEAEASGLERPNLSPAEIAEAFRMSVGGE